MCFVLSSRNHTKHCDFWLKFPTMVFRQLHSDTCIPTTVFRQLYSDNGVPTTVFRQRYSDRLCESPLLSSPFCVTINRWGLFRSTALNSCHKFALCHEQVRAVPKYGIKFLQQICLMPHIKVFRPRYSDKGTPTKVFPQRYSHKGIPTRCFKTLTNTLLRIHLIGWGIPKHNLFVISNCWFVILRLWF